MCEKCRLMELFDEELARFESGEAFSIARRRYALERRGISEGRAMVIAHGELFQEQPDPLAEWKALEPGRKVQHLSTKTVWTITRVGDYGTHIVRDDSRDEIFLVSSNNPLRYYQILPVTTRSFFRGHPVIKSADGAVKGVYKYEIDSPDELDAGLHGFSDEVTVIVDSGEPGGDPTGEDSFEEYMRQALIEWYDGAKVVVKKADE